MPPTIDPSFALPALAGIAIGLWLLVRGMRGYLVAGRISGTSTSSIESIALGEVLVSGSIEPAELILISALQSARCLYYRAEAQERAGRSERTIFREERSVGFRVRDRTGSLRVFPRGARWDVPLRFDARSGFTGDAPPGLRPRSGPAFAPAEPSRAESVAALLTVKAPDPTAGEVTGFDGANRSYSEARLEPGDTVTILGRVLPFSELDDPSNADLDLAAGAPAASVDDPEVAADIAAARADGLLAADAASAWGNAAIPGFGIGRPVRPPVLDPAAHVPELADRETAARFERTFDLEPDTLVLAAADDTDLLVSAGGPVVAAARQRDRLVVGLLGALLSIGSAILLALSLGASAPT